MAKSTRKIGGFKLLIKIEGLVCRWITRRIEIHYYIIDKLKRENNGKEMREVKIKFTSIGDVKVSTNAASLSNNIDKVDTSAKRMTTSMKAAKSEAMNLGNATRSMGNNAGLANASVQALGQGVGDMRYGFGAVANNITQVFSLFGGLITKAGSLTAAFRGVWSAMLGPMGMIFAFQAVVAAIDFFTSRSSKAEKQTKGLKEEQEALFKSMSKATAMIDNVSRGYELGTLKGENLKNAVAQLNEKYEDANLKLDENNELTQDSLKWMDMQVIKLKEQAKNKALLTKIEANYSAELELQNQIGAKNVLMATKLAEIDEYRAEIEAGVSVGDKDILNKKIRYASNELTDMTNEVTALIKRRSTLQEANDKLTAKLQFTEPEIKGTKGGSSNKFSTPEKRQAYLDKLSQDVDELQMELDESDIFLDYGTVLTGEASSDAEVAAEALRGKYEMLNMTRLEQINTEEQMELAKLDGIEGMEETRTAIEKHYSKKRVELAEMEAYEKKQLLLSAVSSTFGNLARASKDNARTQAKFSTAQVLMNTYQGMSEIEKKFGSPEAFSDRAIKVAMQASVLSKGMAGIANIKKAASSVGAAGGGSAGIPQVTTQAPSFNVIGQMDNGSAAVQQSITQLASGSLKAHVVESELTAAQSTAQSVQSQAGMN